MRQRNVISLSVVGEGMPDDRLSRIGFRWGLIGGGAAAVGTGIASASTWSMSPLVTAWVCLRGGESLARSLTLGAGSARGFLRKTCST
jgi:hypothetical protein